jgi:hypothetical protein
MYIPIYFPYVLFLHILLKFQLFLRYKNFVAYHFAVIDQSIMATRCLGNTKSKVHTVWLESETKRSVCKYD